MRMNLDRLKEAEATFLTMYPEGFADPGIQAIRRKHNTGRVVELAQASLTKPSCNRPHAVADALVKIVGRSSMVAVFEKPRFRDFVRALGSDGKEALARAVEQRLHGNKRRGFEALVDLLAPHGIAKWSVVSAVPFYFAPRREVFVKPTTAKRILAYLEVDTLCYRPRPTWEFYRGYRDLIAEVRRHVSPSLAPNNAALTGFLMMSI